MWIMTRHGFYSVVENREAPGNVMVRARAREDLENLGFYLPESQRKWWAMIDIQETPQADYKFRVHLAKAEWATIMGKIAMDIDYPNFKDAVKEENRERALTYLGVWSRLLAIEREGIEPEEFGQRSLYDALGEPVEGEAEPLDWLDR